MHQAAPPTIARKAIAVRYTIPQNARLPLRKGDRQTATPHSGKRHDDNCSSLAADERSLFFQPCVKHLDRTVIETLHQRHRLNGSMDADVLHYQLAHLATEGATTPFHTEFARGHAIAESKERQHDFHQNKQG